MGRLLLMVIRSTQEPRSHNWTGLELTLLPANCIFSSCLEYIRIFAWSIVDKVSDVKLIYLDDRVTF